MRTRPSARARLRTAGLAERTEARASLLSQLNDLAPPEIQHETDICNSTGKWISRTAILHPTVRRKVLQEPARPHAARPAARSRPNGVFPGGSDAPNRLRASQGRNASHHGLTAIAAGRPTRARPS